jgi:DNA-binding HxlR family transcriptional regulator
VTKRRFKEYELETGCGVEACLEVVGGKWKPNLSPRILTAQLRELERDEVIVREVYPVVPPKVEYSLSPAGESLRELIQAMQKWGDRFLVRVNAPVRKTSAK